MEVDLNSSTSSKRGGPADPSLKKAVDVIDHFTPQVKLQFDDISVSGLIYGVDMRLSAQYCVALFL